MAPTSVKAAKPKTGTTTKRISKRNINSSLLVEVAWEVCNQVGGIYTVIRSKTPAAVNRWGNNYCVVGPYIHQAVETEFEEITDAKDPFARTVNAMKELGFDAHYGKWLITGRPTAVLLNAYSVYDRLGSIKYELWENVIKNE